MSISCTKMSPIVRVLALRALAATSERVMPVARNFWYAVDRCSAPTNSHQLVRSYSPSRRSWHEVRICQMRAPKNARSSGVRSADRPEHQQDVPQQVPASRGVSGKPAGTTNVGLPYCVNSSRVVGTR